MWFLRCVRERKFRHVLAEQGEFYQKSRAPRDLRKRGAGEIIAGLRAAHGLPSPQPE